MKRVTAFAVLLVVLAAPAWAGFDEGVAAYNRGDYLTALREWWPLADMGDAGVQSILGFMYTKGHGVTQDYVQAMKWYRKAANQSDAFAQINVGSMYAKGQGVTQDYVQSYMWFHLAGLGKRRVNKKAAKNRKIVAKKMTPVQIAEAQRLARKWRPRR